MWGKVSLNSTRQRFDLITVLTLFPFSPCVYYKTLVFGSSRNLFSIFFFANIMYIYARVNNACGCDMIFIHNDVTK